MLMQKQMSKNVSHLDSGVVLKPLDGISRAFSQSCGKRKKGVQKHLFSVSVQSLDFCHNIKSDDYCLL